MKRTLMITLALAVTLATFAQKITYFPKSTTQPHG
jgi:hypothetical protein